MLPSPLTDETVPLEDRVLIAWLSGVRGPKRILSFLGLPSEASTQKTVAALISTGAFQKRALDARRAVDGTVIDWLKDRALKYALNLDAIADECTDLRVKAQVNQDLLNRLGASATTKIQVGTLAEYKQLVDEYSEKDAA